MSTEILPRFSAYLKNGARADEHVGGTRLRSVVYTNGEHYYQCRGGPVITNLFFPTLKMERTWTHRTRFFARQPSPLLLVWRPWAPGPDQARHRSRQSLALLCARLLTKSRRRRRRAASPEVEAGDAARWGNPFRIFTSPQRWPMRSGTEGIPAPAAAQQAF